MMIIDGFCGQFDRLREEAESAEYREVNYGAAFYGGISMRRPASAWAYERFGAILGRQTRPVIEYFRRYERGMENQTFIHSDAAVSEWTAVLSLREDNGGLCLWRHLALGWIKPDPDNMDGIIQAAQDGFHEERWHMIHKVDMISNRCVLYPAALFHSRWPKDWDRDHARMVQVFFFNCS